MKNVLNLTSDVTPALFADYMRIAHKFNPSASAKSTIEDLPSLSHRFLKCDSKVLAGKCETANHVCTFRNGSLSFDGTPVFVRYVVIDLNQAGKVKKCTGPII